MSGASLKGRVAIVSGGARGIGAGCAAALAAAGAHVIVGDLLEAEGRATAARIGGTFARLDVTDAASWAAIVALAVNAHGRLDVLVNNAGIDIGATIEDAAIEDFRRIIEINLFGQFHGMQAAIPAMKLTGGGKAKSGGSIVNIASLATAKVAPSTTIYGASKAAVANLTRSSALHCARTGTGIRINSVHPGPIATEMVLGAGNARAGDPDMKPLFDAIPLGHLGEPGDVGAMVAYLASDAAAFITGAEFTIDGGLALA
ncbi:SDR family oxidoreductase [Novosphingobium lentum]|uniref:SDR family oxidoreductase n=1 Tax=Novosphingobium lentum TaxID=145287 RepID=UPI00082D290D|nr:SDR family oxidoreductase [Novosphingobium lentum]